MTMQGNEQNKACIAQGEAVLGIEFGSTRIKAVLINAAHEVLASGSYAWENRYENGVWTYSMEDIHTGLQACYRDLREAVQEQYGIALKKLAAIGISGMMHGYLAFDENDTLLVPFRTWRNTMTAEASERLTELFHYPVPQRWSIAHLYQAILKKEAHVSRLAHMTTLAGYVHWRLSGERCVGVGEASGMFPIDSATGSYQREMLAAFEALPEVVAYPWKLSDILPEVKSAGEWAGYLSAAGAAFLDDSGLLEPGCPLCPPEGDAGTGMTATNSVAVRTGNVSAGTSVFAMIVLEEDLKGVYPEIDLVTTPAGAQVGMVHCNNCTSDLNAWVKLFGEAAQLLGAQFDLDCLYTSLFEAALAAEPDCGGLLSYNYVSGEPVTGAEQGRPLFVRTPDSRMTLANFMRTQLYSSIAALKSGLDILLKQEKVRLDSVTGHGGLFKTAGVGQRFLSAAMQAPVTVMAHAGEGGAWGIAILAAYMLRCQKTVLQQTAAEKSGTTPRVCGKNGQEQAVESLEQYLKERVFADSESNTLMADPADVEGFERFMERYVEALPVEYEAAVYL